MSYLVIHNSRVHSVMDEASQVVHFLSKHKGVARAWVVAYSEGGAIPLIGEEVTLGESKKVSSINEVALMAGDVEMGTGQVRVDV